MASERRRSLFRPCIDLHHGTVKQIVGGSLRDAKDGQGDDTNALQTNFVATHPPAHYATLYAQHGLRGGHVIKLGPGNEEAATEALQAWPQCLQVGGGITVENAAQWLERGADKVIVTSYLFPACRFSIERLVELERLVGKDRLVVDISCRRRGDEWVVAMNRWQDLTDMVLSPATLEQVSAHCSELLIHAADVEGLCRGIDQDLVQRLGEWVSIPTTYAGGARRTYRGLTPDLDDMKLVDEISNGRVDLTFGSALDIFGGTGVTLDELVQWNRSGTVGR
ncbi:1-(5-phosphoribosyl)-5[(5-phosphoribosylamino)methylideneamino]imidazole-4-carboxamidisomerase [Malassezia caprae]|uniref:1-(5-phosphoribosyl)-5-[(5-phosphoribosylamino)methylideneamino] imidazole-4-carboxamide isomerase n=1 Tax=Malassezia caprae TaxID=1381934 RepID=A0AAF0E2R1_9BASI|nr:1-(5-phosphoribosyl)-5[(5-phosphoribosylamino)methylideneamino]imidazole-4-carboxamidisomerase [Malassezia caprae]